ncbi:amidohydrolase [Pseudoteredinibacter isoporae]|uniref:amidohydrolase n=1 Tax=Pseudoteredinibacter isoporae TaxID=570281 RepID=UPI003108DDCD
MSLLKTLAKALTGIVLLLTVIAVAIYMHFNPQADDEQAYINARILTMDANGHIAEAMYIKKDRIVAVGSNSDIKKRIDDRITARDMKGAVMMPGIIDAHGHFPGSGLAAVAADLNSPPIGGVKTIADALELLRQQVEQSPKGSWVYAFGFDDTQVAEQRFLTRLELDSVSTEHNIYVSHVSGHMGIANSMAFESVGYDNTTQAPVGGVIALSEDGQLAGLVEENAQYPLVMNALDFGAKQFYAMSRYASDEYLRQGVTSAQVGLANKKFIQAVSTFGQLGIYPQRVVMWPDLEAARAIRAGELSVNNIESERVKLGALKLITDGSIQGYTGFLGHPYHVQAEGKDDDYRGYPTMEREELLATVEDFHKAGWQIALHGNGDAAIDLIIEAYRLAQEKHPREDARPIIIHAQMTRDDQLDQFAELGMTPSFFNSHVYYWGDRHKALFMGAERAARISPMAGAKARGVPFTLHLDTPIVPMTPFLAAWSAVSRETAGGDVLGPEQAISPMDALRAMTIDAAWQIFAEDDRGSIEAGKLADFIVLDRDPLISADALRNVQVKETFIGGVPRFQSAESP